MSPVLFLCIFQFFMFYHFSFLFHILLFYLFLLVHFTQVLAFSFPVFALLLSSSADPACERFQVCVLKNLPRVFLDSCRFAPGSATRPQRNLKQTREKNHQMLDMIDKMVERFFDQRGASFHDKATTLARRVTLHPRLWKLIASFEMVDSKSCWGMAMKMRLLVVVLARNEWSRPAKSSLSSKSHQQAISHVCQ